jgi:L-asparaginase II
MALHAKAAGWPVETYWQPDHPIQELSLQTVATLAEMPPSEIVTATDGCGVVTFGMPLRRLALAYARLADPSGVEDASLRAALERIRDAMMAHPELVAGQRRRLDTALMRTAPGRLVSKGGAEGVQAVGLLAVTYAGNAGPMGLALKIEDGDGAHHARDVTTCEALRQLGTLSAGDLAELAGYASPPITDPRGAIAGVVRPAFRLS